MPLIRAAQSGGTRGMGSEEMERQRGNERKSGGREDGRKKKSEREF